MNNWVDWLFSLKHAQLFSLFAKHFKFTSAFRLLLFLMNFVIGSKLTAFAEHLFEIVICHGFRLPTFHFQFSTQDGTLQSFKRNFMSLVTVCFPQRFRCRANFQPFLWGIMSELVDGMLL